MLCSEFDTRTQKLLDERKPPERDSALLKHAQSCPQCQSQLSTLSKLFDSLDLLEVPKLPDDFAQRVVDSVNQATPSPRANQALPSWLLVVATIAATLLLATLPATWYAMKTRRVVVQPAPGVRQSDTQITTDTLAQSPPSLDSVSEGWMVSSASILELYPEKTRQRHRQQVNQIADDLRPIATPFNAAMTAIRRSLTAGRPETKGQPRASLVPPTTSGNYS